MAAAEEQGAPLLDAARAGSREALGRLLESCRGYLLIVANGELDVDLQAKEGASDRVQETFLEAQRDFGQFQGTSEAELLAWLRRLLLNNIANFTRRYRITGKRSVEREVALDERANQSLQAGLPAKTDSPSGQAVAKEQAVALAQALERLPDDYRQVLRLRFEEGRPFEEIATLMGRSANAVRKLFARAVERVQQEVEKKP
jgi:RNA polymerase sigma-70 factor (ECF subfamily)